MVIQFSSNDARALQAHGMMWTLMEWQKKSCVPDVLVLSTGMWDLLWLGSPTSYEASLRHFASALAAWHASLVRPAPPALL
jgi:hypothetical protein